MSLSIDQWLFHEVFFFYEGFLLQTLTIYRTVGEGGDYPYSSLPLPSTHEHSDIYLQLCIRDASLVITSLLLDEIYRLGVTSLIMEC